MQTQDNQRITGRAKRRNNKRAKEEQDYDKDPPRCENCTNRAKEKAGIPGKRQYLPNRCKVGGFVVAIYAICDAWKGFDGSTLK